MRRWFGSGEGEEEGLVWGDASAVWVEHISTSVSCNKTLGVSGVNHEDDTRDNIECRNENLDTEHEHVVKSARMMWSD